MAGSIPPVVPVQPTPPAELNTLRVAATAFQFAEVVVQSGWVISPEPGQTINPVDGWQAIVAEPLREWHRAMNPNGLSLPEFDRLDRFGSSGPAGSAGLI